MRFVSDKIFGIKRMIINKISPLNYKNIYKNTLNKKPSKRTLNSYQGQNYNNFSYSKNYYINQISFKGNEHFKTLEEANKYFLDNYSAIADFSSLEQAETMDLAIKDFLSKTKIKDKKFLEGVEILSDPKDDTSYLKIACKLKYGYNLDNLEGDMKELYQDYEKMGKVKEFIDVFNPEIINCTILRLGLILNDNNDWNRNNLKNNINKIQDELITLLHLKNSPFDYAIKNDTPPTELEKKIMEEVGHNLSKNEFVEFYALKKLQGENFSSSATNLYRKFGGANLFSEWVDYDFTNVHFNSLKDAKKYFLNEYGIKADFSSLEQAYAIKMAIDDFLSLDTINDKKFLSGVEIKTKDVINSKTDNSASVELLDYEWDYDDDKLALFEKYQLEQREWDFYREIRPDDITLKKVVLYLKSGFSWEAKPKGESKIADISRNIIHHEIGHLLHLKNDPWKYIINSYQKAVSKPEYLAMKNVSDYAATNKLEFVAEYIANKMQGKTFNKDTVELYKALGGPNLFHDW